MNRMAGAAASLLIGIGVLVGAERAPAVENGDASGIGGGEAGGNPITRVTGPAGAPLAIRLKPPVDGMRFLRFGTLPLAFHLSQGFRIRKAWFVAVSDIDKLELVPPADFTGAVALDVEFYRDSASGVGAKALLLAEFGDAQSSARTEAARGETAFVTGTANPVAEKEKPLPPSGVPALSPKNEKETLARASRLMVHGDIGSARLLYEELAVKGSVQGARALAETYDPAFLKKLLVAGLRPNIEQARKWYIRAIELGDREAEARLAALPIW